MWTLERGTRTLFHVLEQRADLLGEQPAYTYLADGDKAIELTYRELRARVVTVAAALQACCAVRDRVLILSPPGTDFVVAFLACSYAGVIAVPTLSPTPARLARMGRWLRLVLADSGSVAVLAPQAVCDLLGNAVGTGIQFVALDGPGDPGGEWRTPTELGADDIGLLQYTSGSTGAPKGVIVTHGNLLANLAYQRSWFGLDGHTEAVIWLPPYHDLGLIGGILQPLYNGSHVTLMSPTRFIKEPYGWLTALSRTQSTHTACPNFGLDLCVQRTTEEDRARLDLSPLRVLLSGGEPVRSGTLTRFADAFAVAGFDPSAFVPAYGLAEVTLMVSARPLPGSPTIRGFDPQSLSAGRAEPAAGAEARQLVGCGWPDPSAELRIVDIATRTALPPRRVGEIWVQSPSVAKGYWNQPEATERVFGARLADTGEGPFLRTGDLGFLADGELFIVGRIDDLVVINGLNYYPHDIEQTLERAHPALATNGGAVVAVQERAGDRLVVVHELDQSGGADLDEVVCAVRESVAAEHGLTVHRVVLIRPGTLPRTRNGKLQRGETARRISLGQLASLVDKTFTTVLPVDTANHAETTSPGDDTVEWIQKELAQVAGVVDLVPAQMPLARLALDSLAIADLVRRLEAHFGVTLSLSDVRPDTTIFDLATFVDRQRGPRAANSPSPRPPFRDLPEFRDLHSRLGSIAARGAENPFFRLVTPIGSGSARVNGEIAIDFASYNYLGLCGDPVVSDAAKRAIDAFGTSASASRLVGGERSLHRELEDVLAALLGTERATVFVSGNLTNLTTIGHLAGSRDLVIHDALAHESIVHGAQLSGAARLRFAHNDWRELDRLLAAVRDRYDRVFVVIEGVYSMDGDIPDVPRFVEVKNRHAAFLMVDEAHSLGVLGPRGRGVGEHFGIDPGDVEIWMGTLSKALASCGGYIAGSARLVDYLRYTAPGLVYSVGLPPSGAAAALAAVHRLQQDPSRVARLRSRAHLFVDLARQEGLDVGASGGAAVVPVVVGDSDVAVDASGRLLRRGVHVLPIVSPAVEEGTARLRFFVSSEHSEEEIRRAVAEVADVVGDLRKGDESRPATGGQR